VEQDCCCHWAVDINWLVKHLGKRAEARRIIRIRFEHITAESYRDDGDALWALAETAKSAMLD
jgi:hypothetical protein